MPKLIRIMIQLPAELKDQLASLKQRGYTTSGFIRAALDRELRNPSSSSLQTMGTIRTRDDDQRRWHQRLVWGLKLVTVREYGSRGSAGSIVSQKVEI